MVNNILLNGINQLKLKLSTQLPPIVLCGALEVLPCTCLSLKWAAHKEICMQTSGHLLYAYLLLGNWSHESHTHWLLQTLISVCSTEETSLSAYAFSHQYLEVLSKKKKKAGHVIYLVGLFNNRPILVPYGLVPSVSSNRFAQIL